MSKSLKDEFFCICQEFISVNSDFDLKNEENQPHEKAIHSLHSIFSKKIEKFQQSVENITALKEIWQKIHRFRCSKNETIFSRFSLQCLEAVEIFAVLLRPDQTYLISSDSLQGQILLSVTQMKILRTLLQFINLFGFYPCFLPHVGISISKRSGFASLFSSHLCTFEQAQHFDAVFLCSLVGRLYSSMDCLLLQPYIVTVCLSDILAALVQLTHSPLNTFSVPIISPRDDSLLFSTHSSSDPLLSTFPSPLSSSSSSSSTSTNEIITHASTTQVDSLAIKDKIRKFSLQIFHQLKLKVHNSILMESLSFLISNNPKCPKWMKSRCASLLSDSLMEKNGVYCLLSNLLGDFQPENVISWRLYENAAHLLSKCPLHLSEKKFYSSVCPQLLNLLHTKQKNESPAFRQAILRIVNLTVRKMAKQNLFSLKKYLFSVIFRPFEIFFLSSFPSLANAENSDVSPGQEILVKEAEMTQSIEDIHKLFVIQDPDESFLDILTPFLFPLFRLFCFTRNSITHVKTATQEILVTYFKLMDFQTCVDILSSILTSSSSSPPNLAKSQTIITQNFSCRDLQFSAGSRGGVVIRSRGEALMGETAPLEGFSEAFVDLISMLSRTGIASSLFVCCLERWKGKVHSDSFKEKDGASSMPQVIFRQKDEETISSGEEDFELIQVMLLMCEKLGASLLEKSSQVFVFISSLLQNDDDHETISLALSLFTAVLSGQSVVLEESNTDSLVEMIPRLETLASHPHFPAEIQEMANFALMSVHSHRASQHGSQKPADQFSRPEDDRAAQKAEQDEKGLQGILDCLKDPFLPVRAQGLILLRKKILEGKSDWMNQHLDLVYEIFTSQISHGDSYIYLTAIHGFVAMVDVYPLEILPRMTNLYQTKSVALEVRLRIAEALLKVAHRMGEAFPKYSHLYLNCFLAGCKDPHETIRASSFSNLGTVCQHLCFSLASSIHEIVECITCTLQFERVAEVKRAAVAVFVFMLKGLEEKNATVSLLGRNLRKLDQIYKFLKFHESIEKDDITKINCRVAISHIDSILLNLFPSR